MFLRFLTSLRIKDRRAHLSLINAKDEKYYTVAICKTEANVPCMFPGTHQEYFLRHPYLQ